MSRAIVSADACRRSGDSSTVSMRKPARTLIEGEQPDILAAAAELGLEDDEDSAQGVGASTGGSAAAKIRSQPDTFEQAARRAADCRYKAAGKRWDSAVAQWLGAAIGRRLDVRARADRGLRAGLRGLRGFFLADPSELSLLQLVDQFASDAGARRRRMYRLRDGNDALPAALAAASAAASSSRRRCRDRAPGVEAARQHRRRAGSEQLDGRLRRRRAAGVDAARRRVHAGAARGAVAGDLDAAYGRATRVLLQFESRFWKQPGRPTRTAPISRPARSGTATSSRRPAGHPQPAGRRPGVARLTADHRDAGMARRWCGGWRGWAQPSRAARIARPSPGNATRGRRAATRCSIRASIRRCAPGWRVPPADRLRRRAHQHAGRAT